MDRGLRYAYDHLSSGHQRAIVVNGELPRGVPIPAPEGWVERSGIFWGENNFISCSADGKDCTETEPAPVSASAQSSDSVAVASPPRVIME